MFNFSLSNRKIIEGDFFDITTIKKIFFALEQIVAKPQNWHTTIQFVDEDTIKNLNNTYRNKNSSTDILTFHYFNDFEKLSPEIPAGDIIICEKKLQEQAKIYWLGLSWEFYKLLIHGLVHMMWFDHETDNDFIEMENIEKKIWQQVFPKQNYPSSERIV